MAREQESVARDLHGLGMRDSEWNKALTWQHLLSLRNVQEEKAIEKSAQNPLDQLAPHLLHPSLMQDIVKPGRGNGLCSQGFTLDHSALGDHGDNRGTMPETMLSLSVSNSNEQGFSAPVLRAQPVIGNGSSTLLKPVGQSPFPGALLSVPVFGGLPPGTQTRLHSSDAYGKQNSAQLTIFYAGNVNVYDDISMDKAHEIMFLAGNGSSWPTKILNPPASQCPSFKLSNAANPQSGSGTPRGGHKISGCRQEKLQLNVQIGQLVADTQPVSGQAGLVHLPANKHPECSKPNTPLPASSSLPSGQPVVPRALPQARKASLARFLEKRKERVKSKCPYLMKIPSPEQLLPEERFSSSNYDAISRTSFDESVDKKHMPMPYGVEEMAGTFEATSICDMDAIEETRLTSAESHIVAEGELAD